MSSRSSSSSAELLQDFLGKHHSRKLLIHNPLNQQLVTDDAPPRYTVESNLDSDVVMILSVLVCGVICSTGANFLIRCLLNGCSRSVYSEGTANSSTPLAKTTGIKKNALKTFPVVKYSAEPKLPGLDTDCVICLSEFVAGERVRLLPKCNHRFHVRCIDKWLRSHSSCPKCRNCLIETSEKISGCSMASSSGFSVPVLETVVTIRPLEPEVIIRRCEGIS